MQVRGDVTFEQFIQAAKDGGAAGLAAVQRFIVDNHHNVDLINAVAENDGNALIWAIYYNHTPIAEALLAVPGIDPNILDIANHTALFWAAYWCNCPIICELLNLSDIAINVVNKLGQSALMLAASRGNKYSVTALLNKKADTSLVNKVGYTAAMLAQVNGHPDVAEQIVMHASVLPPTFKQRLEIIEFNGQIPNHFCCPISFDIMNDPIAISSSGMTYDKQELKKYFISKGNPATIPCPSTRIPLSKNELNNKTTLIIKDMIEEFVKVQENAAKASLEADRKKIQAEKFQSIIRVVEESRRLNDVVSSQASKLVPETERIRVANLRDAFFVKNKSLSTIEVNQEKAASSFSRCEP